MAKQQRIEIEKDILKIWNNWLVECDYHLYLKYGITNGKDIAKDFIINQLEGERGFADRLSRIPF